MTITASGDLEVTAVWREIVTITCLYDADGEVFDIETCPAGGYAAEPAERPFRNGAAFLGWKLSGSDDFSVSEGLSL